LPGTNSSADASSNSPTSGGYRALLPPLASATSNANPFAPDGGLLQLGTDLDYIGRRAAEYVHRIIHGARPSELPVERPAKFRLSVNLTTAKAIGIIVPSSILARADEVIE